MLRIFPYTKSKQAKLAVSHRLMENSAILMKALRIFVLCIMMAILAEAALAASGHTTLLATSEPLQGGVTADLYLETKPGTGRVFIESSPLTKIDTQISTRFAKDIACEYTGKDCSGLDFFYAIKADAAIIGGPSAGAAMAALTVGVLEGAELNQSVAITGTINSGNVLGHVGGIAEKIEAARDSGIRKVLIPKGEVVSEFGNRSVDAIEYGKAIGIDVAEVFSLEEAMTEFTGKTFAAESNTIKVDPRYSKVMERLASMLCGMTEEFEMSEMLRISEHAQKSLISDNGVAGSEGEIAEFARNLSRQGFAEREKTSYYAAASFCFGANVRYRYLELASQNLTGDDITENVEEVKSNIDKFEKGLKKASTVSDAQALAVIRDRAEEAKLHANTSIAALKANNTNLSTFELAFAIERLKSAEAWSSFLGAMSDSPIPEEMLKNACANKLAEARERVEYSAILIGSSGDGAAALLDKAQNLFDKADYVQCLHKATLSKSEANALLGVIGMRDEDISQIVEGKVKAAEKTIARQSKKGIFPIIGYSYYEYSGSLRETDKYSALLFSEYALEFSNLDIYFRQANTTLATAGEGYYKGKEPLLKGIYFFGSFAAGVIVALMILGKRRKKGRILVRKAAKARKRRS